MRILISGSTYLNALHGQAIFTHNLADGLAYRGNQVMLLLPQRPYPPRENPCPSGSFQIVTVPAVQPSWMYKELCVPIFYKNIIKKQLDTFQPDLIHVQDASPLCQELVVEAHKRNIPVMATHHVGEDVCAPYLTSSNHTVKRITEWVVWRLFIDHLSRADLVTVPSQSSITRLERQGLKPPVQRVPCPVCLDNFFPDPAQDRDAIRQKYGLSSKDILVLYVGRVDIEKRVDILVRSLPFLPDTHIKIVIAGQGAQIAPIHSLANHLGIIDRVIFLGQVAHEQLPSLFNCCDIFAMPGDGESFSIATLEALACGLPVLAARSSALPELVTNQKTGFLFTPGDPQDAARGITYIIDQKYRWDEMKAAAVEKADTYNLDAVMSSYEKAYQYTILLARQKQQKSQDTSIHFPIPRETWRHTWQHSVVLVLMAFFLMATSVILTSQSTQAATTFSINKINSVALLDDFRDLMLTPHPDDETLEAIGSIHGEIESDGDVRVDIIIRGEDPSSDPIITKSYTLPVHPDP